MDFIVSGFRILSAQRLWSLECISGLSLGFRVPQGLGVEATYVMKLTLPILRGVLSNFNRVLGQFCLY